MAWTMPGDRVDVTWEHRRVIWYELNGKWILKSGSGVLGGSIATACPAPITGTITSASTGNRINLTFELVGPAAPETGITAMFDTGGDHDYFPNVLLQKLGITPCAQTTVGGIVPGATATAELYLIPGRAFQILDQGHRVALARGTLIVWGIESANIQGLGPDILKHGAKLSTWGNHWTLLPPCSS